MKISLPTISVYFYLLIIFIFEGLGMPSGRFNTLIIVYTFPFVLFLTDFWNKNVIAVPEKLTVTFILFSVFTAISTVFAVHIQTAFEHQLFYLGIFIFFLYVYNHKDELINTVPFFIALLTVILLLYALFINLILPDNLSFLIPVVDYQFPYVQKTDDNHYAFGAFLLIPLVLSYCFHAKKFSLKTGVLVFTLFIGLLLSFLRAAYLAFTAVALLAAVSSPKIKKNKIQIIIFLSVIILTVFLITDFRFYIPIISDIHTILINRFEVIEYKFFLNGRLEFFQQAVLSVLEKPLTGFGPFNYFYASMRFTSMDAATTGSSHNLLLDIFVEHGVVSGVIFLFIIILFIKSIWIKFFGGTLQEKSVSSVFFALFILFQFSHYHKFYFLFIIFFFIAALLYSEKQIVKDIQQTLLKASLCLVLLAFIIVASTHFLKKHDYRIAQILYPISAQAIQSEIVHLSGEKRYYDAERSIQKLYSLHPENPLILDFIGNYYTNKGDHTTSIEYYKQALQYAPHEVVFLTFIYESLVKTGQEDYGKKFVEDYVKSQKIYISDNKDQPEMRWFYKWCFENKLTCDY